MKRTIGAYFGGKRKFFDSLLGKEFCFTSNTDPYEYLSGCFMLTSASSDRESDFADIPAEGEKRKEVQRTMIQIKVGKSSYEGEFLSSVGRAKNECRIYRTIESVSSAAVKTEFI